MASPLSHPGQLPVELGPSVSPVPDEHEWGPQARWRLSSSVALGVGVFKGRRGAPQADGFSPLWPQQPPRQALDWPL